MAGWYDSIGGSPYPTPTGAAANPFSGSGTDWWKNFLGNGNVQSILGNVGAGLLGVGQYFAGRGQNDQMPRQTGWKWQEYTGGFGEGGRDLNPYTSKWEGMIAKATANGGKGYFDEWQSGVMNPLTQMVSGLTKDRGALLQEQVSRMVNPALESAMQQYGVSGAATDWTSKNIGNAALQAQTQAEQDKLNMLTALGQQTYQGGLQGLLQGGQLFGQAERVAPTLTPTFEEPQKENPSNDFWGGLTSILGAALPLVGLFL